MKVDDIKQVMRFLRGNIKQVREGGLLVIKRKIHNLPYWLGITRISKVERLIKEGHYDKAFNQWQKLFSKKPFDDYTSIQRTFIGGSNQSAKGQAILQAVLNAHNKYVKENHLDNGNRYLIEWTTAMGHIALLDNYVKMGILGKRSSSRPVVLISSPIANRHYLEYWRTYLHMVEYPQDRVMRLARHLEDHMSGIMNDKGEMVVNIVEGQAQIQAEWEKQGHGALLTLTDTDHRWGWDYLESLGVPRGAWFVSLHVREHRDISRGARDADISTYLLAIRSIVEKGGWVIRMGDSSTTPLPLMYHVIDYAHSEQHDWMDVFLWAECKFFIGTQSGPVFVPPTFGVPCVCTNFFPVLFRRWFGQDIYIPKLLSKDGSILSFPEALKMGTVESLDFLKKKGLKLIDNTPEEISEVVLEMVDRLKGKSYSDEDEELQSRFNDMWEKNAFRATGRIGRGFLNKYAYLMEE